MDDGGGAGKGELMGQRFSSQRAAAAVVAKQ
jgi:hypothetical protein